MAGSTRTPKARALGNALAAARNEHGITQRQLATKVKRSPGTIARWETGERIPRPTDIAQILMALDVSKEKYDEILAMTRGANQPEWLATTLPDQRAQLNALVVFEQDATKITHVAPLLIPGVLQTSDYIDAIMVAAGVPRTELATRRTIRVGRREVITGRDPAHLVALVGEAAVRQVIGSREIMISQLRYLLELADLRNVEIRVIPYGSGWHPGLEGAFLAIESHEDRTVVYVEMRDTGLFLHEEDTVNIYRHAADSVLKVAMNPQASREFIAAVIKEMEITI